MGDDVWQRTEIIQAVGEEDFATLLRTWRVATGTSQAAAAALCGLSQPDVSAIEHRHRLVTSAAVRDRILSGLGVPPGMRPRSAGSAPVPTLSEAPDGDTADRVEAAVGGDRLDRPVLDYLTRTLAEHRRMEDRLGARALLPVVAAQAAVLARLMRSAPAGLRDDALSLSAQFDQFLGWMYHDQRDGSASLGRFATAESKAQEAGDPTMAANVLSLKAHLAWSAGNPLASVRFAQAAQWPASRITPAAAGMAAQVEARGLALLRDPDGADEAQARAQALLDRAAQNPEDEPPWLYFYDAEGVWLRMQQGSVQLDLGRAERAVEELEAALGALDPSYVRDAAWYRAVLVRALAVADRIEQAAAAAVAVLPDALATNGFAMDHLKASARLMARRAPSDATVRGLAEALAGEA